MKRFTATELREYLDSAPKKPLLIDVREPWEYEIVKIEGSKLHPLGRLPELLDEVESTDEVVLICHHGNRSRYAAHFLQQNGIPNVINLEGGVDDWARSVDTTLATY